MVLRNVTRHPLRAAASVFGIAFAVAILMIGFVFSDAIDALIADAVLGGRAAGRHGHLRRAALGRRPPRAGPPARRDRGRAAAHGRRPGALGPPRALSRPSPACRRIPRFKRIVDRDGRPIRLPPSGRRAVADAGRRARRRDRATASRSRCSKGPAGPAASQVTGLVDDILGLSVYMDLDALHRMMREGDVASGALLLIDRRAGGAAVAGAEGARRPWPAPGSSARSCRASARRWPRT